MLSCLRYCKSTIFQANHNRATHAVPRYCVVCDTAKVRFFKQITTLILVQPIIKLLFAILQKYDFSSKSQPKTWQFPTLFCCLRYCKSTIFQANHNLLAPPQNTEFVVCDTAKVRFFKQITTKMNYLHSMMSLFAILQKYDFSSKSQPTFRPSASVSSCLRYCKSTIFQANHNAVVRRMVRAMVVCDTAKVRFFKQITTSSISERPSTCCLRYCKSTIFQANHNTRG